MTEDVYQSLKNIIEGHKTVKTEIIVKRLIQNKKEKSARKPEYQGLKIYEGI